MRSRAPDDSLDVRYAASTALLLASERAGNVTGAGFLIDGGLNTSI